MALLPIQILGRDSIDFNYIAATDSDTVKNTSNFDVVLLVKNDSEKDVTVTIQATAPCDQSHYHDEVITVKSGSESKPIPLHSRVTAWQTLIVNIGYSSIENVKVCAYRQVR